MLGDFRSVLRSLRGNPGFAIFVVAIVALGIGASTAIFSILHAVLLRPLNYPESDRLFEVGGRTAKGTPTQITPAVFEVIRQRSQTIERSALLRMRPVTILGKEGAESAYAQAFAGDGLRVFGTTPVVGRLFQPEAIDEVVLSHRLWMRRYNGDAGVIGRVITLNDEGFTIVGVMPPEFETTNRVFQLWLPWRFSAPELAERSSGGFQMLVRRRASVSEEQVRTEILAIGQVFGRDLPADLRGWRTTLMQLKERRVGQYRQTLWVLLGAVVLLLVTACLNAACLMIARAQDRRKEVALRLALGAPRWRVMQQFLVESLALSAAGGLLGLMLASWGTRAIIALSSGSPIFPRLSEARMDGSVLLFGIALALLTGIVCGLAPAWQTSKLDAQDALQHSARGFAGNRKAEFARNAAVTLQVALSLVLLAGAGLLMRSFVNLLRTDPGFRPGGLLTARIPSGTGQGNEVKLAAHYASILESAEALPGVQAAALSTVIPLGPVEATSTLMADTRGATSGQVQMVQYRAVSPSYFEAVGIPLLRGRPFDEHDTPNNTDVVIINDVAAQKYWPGEDPIGKRVATSFDGGEPKWMPVVGVAGGVRQNLTAEPKEELYRPYTQHLFAAHGAVLILQTNREPQSLITPLRMLLREAFPQQPVAEIRTMNEWLDQSFVRPRFDAALLTVFATVALVIASLGVYALISYGVRRRWREIGVRMALGATPGDVSSMVIKQAVWLIAAGVTLGMAGASALTRFLAAQLYGVKPHDPLILATACGVLIVTGLVASWGPAHRAARIDPGNTLHQE